ncbi:ExbD/TolR family protein [Yoonia vestfoldensis]|uniref:Biopolymer transporter ExbD n=1 Tax=Yoonia vestfoldensis TaxID=245188 RepID=A0A1Y0EC65_9RHOB|nr:biopolymer transporter ExbD [Yoonia vestfoldensis]ARU01204.1 biopolymer transporter ExbD [Yoonia vestfoldensis]
MRLAPPPRAKPEPTIALINVVFLMLVFFLIAGQVAQPLERDMQLVDADIAAARVPDDALVVLADGTLLWRAEVTTPAAFAAAQADQSGGLRLLPDRNLPARELIALAAALRSATGQDLRLVTQTGLAP